MEFRRAGAQSLEEIRDYVLVGPGQECPLCGAQRSPRQRDLGECWSCEEKRLMTQVPRRRPENPWRPPNGTPPRYADCTPESWKGAIPPLALAWLLKERKPDLVFMGPTGTGKTHLATLIAGKRSLGSRWVSAAAFLEKLKLEMGSDYDGETMERHLACSLLVLDDLGAELLTGERGEWRQDRIAYLLTRRYDDCLPTIITTNLTGEQIAKASARLASRLLSGVVVQMTGKDRRFGL